MNTEVRLARLRGSVLPRNHNARTIAALAANPGCSRRAMLDAAGVDKEQLALRAGFPAPFGQSKFALARGNAFESQLKADGAAQLLALLREELDLPTDQAHYTDISDVGGNESVGLRHARTEILLSAPQPRGAMFDHPLLRLAVGGRHAYLEPDLLALRLGGRFHVVEIKSFAVIDGQADGAKTAAAAIQSAVYVLALTDLVGERVHYETILVCPKDFSNRPVASRLDVRKQLTVLRRQLSRIACIDDLLDLLPSGLTLDTADAIRQIEARYAPDCLSTCEMCYFCRDEAASNTIRLGKPVLEDLGGIDSIPAVLRLARGAQATQERAEAAAVLRAAAILREDVTGEAV